MDYFGLPHDIERCEQALQRSRGRGRLALLAELAWYFRQRDAERASALLGEARTLLEEPIECDDGERDRIEGRLLALEGEAAWLSGHLDEALTRTAAARACFERAGDCAGMGDIWLLEASALGHRDGYRAVEPLYALAAQCYASSGDHLRSQVCAARMATRRVFVEVTPGVERPSGAVHDKETSGHPGLLAIIEATHLMAHANAGEFSDAIRHGQRAFELHATAGQLSSAIVIACNVGTAYMGLSDHAGALEWMERGVELARRTCWPRTLGVALQGMGEALQALDRRDTACDLLRESLRVLQRHRGTRAHVNSCLSYGALLLDLGQFAQALELSLQGVVEARRLGQADLLAKALCLQARTWCSLQEPTRAFACADEARSLVERSGMRMLEIDTLRVLASIARDHHLAPPEESRAASAPIHYLETAMRIGAGLAGYAVPDDMLSELSDDFEAVGLPTQALAWARAAAIARDKAHSRQADNLATALQVRHQTERARAEADHQRLLLQGEARRAELLDDANSTLERLAVVGQEITSCLDVETVFHTLHRHVGALLHACALSIWLCDADGLSLQVGVSAGQRLPCVRVRFDDAVSGVARCVRERRELFIDPSAEPGALGDAVPAPAGVNLHAPLVFGGDVIGVLSVQSDRRHIDDERGGQILRSLAAYGAVALTNARIAAAASEARAELEREKMRNMVVHVGKLATVGRLASGVVHEMAHPLNTIVFNLAELRGLLACGDLSSAGTATDRIDHEVTRLTRLLRRLRDFSRSEPPQIADHDLCDLLADARLLFLSRLKADGIVYEEALVPVRVRVDPERLCLAIANVVINAADVLCGCLSPQIFVSIKTGTAHEHACDTSCDKVALTIRDTGPGLSPEVHARLFEPFFTTKPRGQGLGLGLALSAESLASMGGHIEASNHPDGGAAFTLWLPRA